jgi:opacity protein-like surface antigen
MKRLTAFLLCAMLCLAAGSALAAEGDEAAAEAAAGKWLALCDAGKYSESWREASSFFRGAVTEDVWNKGLAGLRAPLGPVQKRVRNTVIQARSLPGAPDGSYVVLTYDTSFAQKAAAIETVTVMHEKDGSWRLVGYYIK